MATPPSGPPPKAGAVFARRFSNDQPALSRTVQDLLAFLPGQGVGEPTLGNVNLAVEEMATNTLKYGYDDPGVHQLDLRVEVRPGSVEVVLEDDGHEFDPLSARPPDVGLPLDQRPVGGLGIALVRRLSESMRYERLGGPCRNRLTIVLRRG